MAVQILFRQQLHTRPPGVLLCVYPKEFDLDAESFLAVCNDEGITEEEISQGRGFVKIIPVISRT